MHYLDFERPIAELEGKIVELKKLAEEDPNHRHQWRGRAAAWPRRPRWCADTYARLVAWQKVQVARHPERPHFLGLRQADL